MAARVTAVRFVLLALAVSLLVAATMVLGPRWIPWAEIVATDRPSYVFWHLRVPRALLAAVAGAGLAIGGVLFQAVFRNPLAEPYTLGVAGGASFAAALGFLFGWRGAGWLGVPPTVLLAFAGAFGALGLVYLVSRLRPRRDFSHLLLAGVCVAYMCSAGILLVTFLADRAVTNEIVVWMMGSLGVLRPRAGLEVAFALAPVFAYGIYAHRALDLLTLGPELAATRGVHVARTVWTTLGLCGLLVGVIVANCGPIGFVGLMVPHMARALCGVRTRPLLCGAALLGAAFLAVCDGLARSLPVVELPVGVVTNILGAVFFLYLLVTRETAEGA
jgi:iron complex transport system permease protein